MRIKGKLELTPFAPGKVDLVIDNIEDLWTLYNIISKGDFIKTAMFRKIQHESGGGKVQSTKKKLIITIKIEEIDYDQNDGIIRLKGKNVSQNENIAIDQFQTCEISQGSFFSLYKKYWDEIHIDTLKASTDNSIKADLAALIMEEGVAHLYLISNNLTTLQGKVTQSIPKKRTGSTGHDKSKKEFFSKILNQLVKQINFEIVKCVVVASPGFTKDEFGDYMTDQVENNMKVYETIKANLKKFIYVHSSSGYKQSLEEVLSKPEIKKMIKSTKCTEDTAVMERFNEVLGVEMDKAFFGIPAFEIACSKNAVDTLIITDNFLRKISPTTRKHITMLIKGVKSNGGKVVKMSSQHVTGEKIDSFGGIVGILTYVVPEIGEIGMDNLEIEDKKEEETEDDIEGNEALTEMMNNNLAYNDEEGNENEDVKEDKNKRKKSKEEMMKEKKEKRKTANQRKRSSFDDDEDY